MPTLSDDERFASFALQAALRAFLDERVDFPAQMLNTFLLVAGEEGLGVLEYAERAGVAKSVMSRHILDLSIKDRYGNPGMGLLQAQPRPEELRKHMVTLTPKGRALYRKVINAWKMRGR